MKSVRFSKPDRSDAIDSVYLGKWYDTCGLAVLGDDFIYLTHGLDQLILAGIALQSLK